MIGNENSFDKLNKIVILCKKCYEKKVYTIVIVKVNRNTINLEYYCSKCDIIDKSNIIKVILNEDLSNLLNNCRCKEHQDNKYCAWCEESKENLCSFCIGEKLKKKERYTLYMEFLEKMTTQQSYHNQIIKLESLYNKYKRYLPNHIVDIKLINRLIFCAQLAFNYYYEEKIYNYQAIKNYSLNLENLVKDIDKYEKMFYKYCLSGILNKDESKIKINILKLPFTSSFIKLIPLKDEFDENNYYNDSKKILKKNNYFALFDLEKNILYVYDIDGNIINIIELDKKLIYNNKTEIIQYEPNILLLFNGSKFIFIFFSNSFQKFEILEYNSEITAKKFPKDIYIDNYGINSKLKLIKFNEKNVFFLYLYNLFIIDFYEQQKNKTSKIKLNKSLDKEFIFDMISINYKDEYNEITKELICASPELSITNDLFGFGAEVKECRNIQIIIYGNDLKKKESFFVQTKTSISIKQLFFELNYNNLNNALLLVVKDTIMQISLKSKEITTIYEIIEPFNSLCDNDFKIIKMCDGPFKFLVFHDYNEKKKNLEKIVLLKNNLYNKIYYLYYWHDNTLLFKENYEMLDLIDLTELNMFKNNENGEKIFIHEDNLIIF